MCDAFLSSLSGPLRCRCSVSTFPLSVLRSVQVLLDGFVPCPSCGRESNLKHFDRECVAYFLSLLFGDRRRETRPLNDINYNGNSNKRRGGKGTPITTKIVDGQESERPVHRCYYRHWSERGWSGVFIKKKEEVKTGIEEKNAHDSSRPIESGHLRRSALLVFGCFVNIMYADAMHSADFD